MLIVFYFDAGLAWLQEKIAAEKRGGAVHVDITIWMGGYCIIVWGKVIL